MLKSIAIFITGLAIGASYPNEARNIVNTALSYIKNSINSMQSNLNTTNTSQPQQTFDYSQVKKNIDNTDLAKNLPEDWR